MPKFPSAKEAFEWALEYCELRGTGRSIQYNPDYIGSLGVPLNYAYLDAIQIMGIAEQHDRRNGKLSWFVAYYCPIPIIQKPNWTDHEMRDLTTRIKAFECGLAICGFIPHCGKQRCERRG